MNHPTARPAILFVDDEADLLAGIRLALRSERAAWDLHFAAGAEAGLALLAQRPFDVVVTDMRMPGMDGATLLGVVRARWPAAVRIVLSGQADESLALRAIPVSHRWLTKPCDRQQIVTVLQQAIASRQYARNPAVQRILGDAAFAPSLPRLYDELMLRIARPDFGLEQIAEVVNRDPGMAARVLQLANSALFRRAAPLHSLTDAVTMLGLRTLSHLLLAAEVFVALRNSAVADATCEEIERRALQLSRVAASLFPDDAERAALASTAGLLHEVGTLVLVQHDAAAYAAARARARAGSGEPDGAERELFGASHAEVGAALLCTWGLPMELVDAMAQHHDAARWHDAADLAAALRFAEVVVGAPWLAGTLPGSAGGAHAAWSRCAEEALRG